MTKAHTLGDWKKEFYPVKAYTFKGLSLTKKNFLRAIDHCIRKYRGVLRSVLARSYKTLIFKGGRLRQMGRPYFFPIWFSSTSCSLCQIVGNGGAYFISENCCRKCPLGIAQGGSCSSGERNQASSAYRDVLGVDEDGRGDSRLMLKMLKKARKIVESGDFKVEK